MLIRSDKVGLVLVGEFSEQYQVNQRPNWRHPMGNREQATRSLLLANSLLDDVNENIHPITDIDPSLAPSTIVSLNAALKAVDEAEKLVQRPTITVAAEQGEAELTSADLRATALLFRGIIRGMTFDDLDSAITDVKESIRLAPEFANGHHLLGVFYFDTGKPLRAMNAIDEAIALDPDNLEFQKAKATWQQILEERAVITPRSDNYKKIVSSEKVTLRYQLIINVVVLATYIYALSTTPNGQTPAGWALFVMAAWAFFAFKWIMSTSMDFFNIVIVESYREFGLKYLVGTVVVFVLGIVVLPFLICFQLIEYVRMR